MPGAILLLMYTIASFDVVISVFSKELSSSFCTLSFRDITDAISLSDSNPRARIKVIIGISTGEPGILATISPSSFSTNSSFAR